MSYIKRFIKYNESKKTKNIKKYLIGDFVVIQGKDAEANDYVTLEMSEPEDLWFHAKGVPGSHVIIKVKENLPTEDVIKQTAEIAAKNCKSKDGKVTILYCKKRFVRKGKDMKTGEVSVDYKNANEIVVLKK